MFIQLTDIGTTNLRGINTDLVQDVAPNLRVFNSTHGTTLYFGEGKYREVSEPFDVVMDKLNGK